MESGHSTPCWIWLGAISNRGYGTVTHRGRTVSVHRILYKMTGKKLRGRTHDLDHLCRNRPCCNPSHLQQVLKRTNTRRGLACKRGQPCTKCGGQRFGKQKARRCLDCRKNYDTEYSKTRRMAKNQVYATREQTKSSKKLARKRR